MRHSTNAHYNAIFDLTWMFGEMKIVTASGDHTARLFNISESEIIEDRIFHGHTRSVKTVAFRKDDPAVFATGSRDGSIYLWDTRATVTNNYIKQPDTIISNSHNIPNTPSSATKTKKKFPISHNVSAANSVTSIVFQDDNTLISCGAGDGVIKVWDMRKNYLVHKREPIPKYTLPYMGNTSRNGFSNLVLDSSGIKLYANCMDNNIYCYNLASYNPSPIMTYAGHQNSTFYIKSSVSSDGEYLLSGSSDQNAYIWSANKSTPLISLTGHSAEVTCVAWCQKQDITLITCSDDMKYKIWRLHPGDLPDDWPIEGRGSAVSLPDQESTKLLNTPSSKKRIIDTTPHSQRKRAKVCENCQMLTPGNVEILRCQNCVNRTRSAKRSATQASLSPGNESKRQNSDRTPRRLFDGNSASTSELATVLEESPSKECFSPTANLPNFVFDGEAPHLRKFSPRKRADKDWLTKMRIEHHLRNRLEELSRPTSPKQLRFSESSYVSPKASSLKKPKRTTPNNSNSQSPLLKFFKVTNNSRSCEHQYSPLSNKNSTINVEISHVHL